MQLVIPVEDATRFGIPPMIFYILISILSFGQAGYICVVTLTIPKPMLS